MARPLRRVPLELGLDLNINRLLSDGIIEPGQAGQFKDVEWLDAAGDVKADARISADMTMNATAGNAIRYGTMRIVAKWINQTIQIVGCPRHFGGLQWYFVCPRENRNVSVLWSPPGKRFFAGRKSWGNQVAYLSQFYAPGQRAHYMVNKLCDRHWRAWKPYGTWELPPKPKWMRWKTYERLMRNAESYYGEATTFPIQYRLSGDVV